MKTETKHVQPHEAITSDVTPMGWTETTYGREINAWLDSSNEPKKYYLRTSHKPDNTKTTPDHFPLCCFHGGVDRVV